MNKRYIASAIMTGALLASGSAFAANSGAPSNTPNDSTGVPLNRPSTQGATAPAPAGSNSTMGSGNNHSTMGSGKSNSTMGSGTTYKSGTMNGTTHSGGTHGSSATDKSHSGSNMQPGTTNRGNGAQPSQPRPVTGN